MTNGVVYNDKPLTVLAVGWTPGVQEIVVLVDTGFTGELKISPAKAEEKRHTPSR